MHALKLECKEQGCGAVVHLTVCDLSDEEHVDMVDVQYYVDHRVPARCGICLGHNWEAYGVSYVPVKQKEWSSVS